MKEDNNKELMITLIKVAILLLKIGFFLSQL